MVSVIIPLYNQVNLFPETIDSVLRQTYTDWETIIIDDHSTDGSYQFALKISENDTRFKVVKNVDGKKGASSARNMGLSYATGQLIIFLDSDDLLAPDCLKQRVDVMKSENMLDFAVFRQATFSTADKEVIQMFNRYPRKKGDDYLKMFLRNENPWSVTCPIWKKEVLLNLGGFDEDLTYMEDPDLHVRAILNSNKFYVFKNLPVDSFYRIGNMDSSKANVFYTLSILSRIDFLKKMVRLISVKNDHFKKNYFPSIKAGYLALLKHFMLARLECFSKDFYEITNWLKSRRVLNKVDYLCLLLVGKVFLSKSPLVRTFRFKGLVFEMISKGF